MTPALAAIVAIIWMATAGAGVLAGLYQRHERKLAEKRLAVVKAQLATYRQWADPHIHLAFPDPSKHDGGDAR